MKETLYEAVGGLATLEKVHKIFYEKIYADPWIGQFFAGHDQTFIENRQTQFMAEKFGGPDPYMGKSLEISHEHMYITEELFQLRKKILTASLQEVGLDSELVERWLKIDSAFKKKLIKNSIEEYYRDYSFAYKKRIIFPKPQG